MDVIANAKAGPGTVGFGVYNVWNTDYKSVYSQAVESVYGAISSLPAQGRTYGLSYTLNTNCTTRGSFQLPLCFVISL